jgi:hypothetical protein
MLNKQTMERMQRTTSWVLSPGRSIDRLLDYIETLSSFVLPAQADNPARGPQIEARPEQLAA